MTTPSHISSRKPTADVRMPAVWHFSDEENVGCASGKHSLVRFLVAVSICSVAHKRLS